MGSNPWKGVAPSPTPWCSSYRKGSLRVTLDYGRQQNFLLTLKLHFINCSFREVCKMHMLSSGLAGTEKGWVFLLASKTEFSAWEIIGYFILFYFCILLFVWFFFFFFCISFILFFYPFFIGLSILAIIQFRHFIKCKKFSVYSEKNPFTQRLCLLHNWLMRSILTCCVAFKLGLEL